MNSVLHLALQMKNTAQSEDPSNKSSPCSRKDIKMLAQRTEERTKQAISLMCKGMTKKEAAEAVGWPLNQLTRQLKKRGME